MSDKQTTPLSQDEPGIPCYKCKGHLSYPKKLTWVCDDCGTDNSVFVVMALQATNKKEGK